MFNLSDAWVLLSLIYSREFVDGKELRTVGDYINHAIFTDEELEGGLVRLLEAGHAITRENKFAPSKLTLAWYEATIAGKSRTSVQKDLERVEKLLGL